MSFADLLKRTSQAASPAPASAPAPAPAAPVPAAVPAPTPNALGATLASGKQFKIGVLCLNCGPVGISCPDATGLLYAAKGRLARGGVADWRMIDYGKGAGYLLDAFISELEQGDFYPYLRLDTTTPEGSIVAMELSARAATVIR